MKEDQTRTGRVSLSDRPDLDRVQVNVDVSQLATGHQQQIRKWKQRHGYVLTLQM